MWAGISTRDPTEICIFEGTINAKLYMEILQTLLYKVYPNGHYFMQDDNPKHTFKQAIISSLMTSTGEWLFLSQQI